MPGQTGYFWNAYNGIGPIFHTDQWHLHTRPVDNLVKDIQANNLPAVTWVDPRFELSDHPPVSSGFTHNWVTDVVNALMKSDMWEHTALFVTWDEWGGFYDSVMPPEVDDIGLGFRVPLLTISPYTRRGLIDDELGEFSTPLRFISDNWGLDHLTPRIAKTHDMSHIFDFKAKPRPPQPSSKRAPTYGSPWVFPTDYPGWPAGTVPADQPLLGAFSARSGVRAVGGITSASTATHPSGPTITGSRRGHRSGRRGRGPGPRAGRGPRRGRRRRPPGRRGGRRARAGPPGRR